MIAYFDASALLRIALKEPGALDGMKGVDRAGSSTIVRTECYRTLDRYRIRGAFPPRELGPTYDAANRLLRAMEMLEVDRIVLQRAAQPLPAPLGTLDAIHLVTALRFRERLGEPVVMATHDRALAEASRAFGFSVVGA